MKAYLPSGPEITVGLAGLWLGMFFLGFALPRVKNTAAARWAGWLLLGLGTTATDRLCATEAPGFRMLALILSAFLAIKTLVTTEAHLVGMRPLRLGEWSTFALGWPGMNPKLFGTRSRGPVPGAGRLVRMGATRLGAGIALVVAARLLFDATGSHLLLTVLLLPGLSLILHFGFFNILAGFWRLKGVHCSQLFRAPLKAQSLNEFWGKRWNLAFIEMSILALMRPLAPVVGRKTALFIVFAVSGLLHEMAISLPVMAGFGLPTLYFLLQGGLVLAENSLTKRGLPVTGIWGRVWTLFWLAAPVPLLFHLPFLKGIIWPLIGLE